MEMRGLALAEETEKPEDNIVLQLRQSAKKRGYLHPVLKDQLGRIVAGETRKKADPKWPEKTVHIEDDLDFYLSKISDNIHGVKDKAWWDVQLNAIAKVLVDQYNVKKGKVVDKMVELLKISRSKIESSLSKEYKSEEMSKLGKLSAKAKADALDNSLHKVSTKGEAVTTVVTDGTAEVIESMTGKPSEQGSTTKPVPKNPVADFTVLLSEINVYPETAVKFEPGPEEVLLPKKKKKPYVVDFLIGNVAIQLDKKVVLNPMKENGLWKNHELKVIHIPIRLIYQEREALESLIDAMANYWNPGAPEFRNFRKSD